MAATADQIARLRRMVAEPTDTTYSDGDLTEYIERYPLMDERGEIPYTWDASTEPPTQDANEEWLPTYDLNAAAADIWDEKAAGLAGDFDFQADGGRYDRSQAYNQMAGRARYYRSRRSPGTITQRPYPQRNPETPVWLGNAAEGDDE